MKAYPVLESEMDSIGDANERETNALAFGGMCCGAFISGLLALLLATPDSPAKWAAYAGVMGCLFIMSLFCGRAWWFERGVRQRTIAKIKSRPRQVELAPSIAGDPKMTTQSNDTRATAAQELQQKRIAAVRDWLPRSQADLGDEAIARLLDDLDAIAKEEPKVERAEEPLLIQILRQDGAPEKLSLGPNDLFDYRFTRDDVVTAIAWLDRHPSRPEGPKAGAPSELPRPWPVRALYYIWDTADGRGCRVALDEDLWASVDSLPAERRSALLAKLIAPDEVGARLARACEERDRLRSEVQRLNELAAKERAEHAEAVEQWRQRLADAEEQLHSANEAHATVLGELTRAGKASDGDPVTADELVRVSNERHLLREKVTEQQGEIARLREELGKVRVVLLSENVDSVGALAVARSELRKDLAEAQERNASLQHRLELSHGETALVRVELAKAQERNAELERTPQLALGVRSVVGWFAQHMERVLAENDHKGGWEDDAAHRLFRRLREETEELATELRGEKGYDAQRVLREAVDVANFAMMIADIAAPGDRAVQPPIASAKDGEEHDWTHGDGERTCRKCGRVEGPEMAAPVPCTGKTLTVETIATVAASLPTSEDDERIVDELMARRAAGLKETPIGELEPAVGSGADIDDSAFIPVHYVGGVGLVRTEPVPQASAAEQPMTDSAGRGVTAQGQATEGPRPADSVDCASGNAATATEIGGASVSAGDQESEARKPAEAGHPSTCDYCGHAEHSGRCGYSSAKGILGALGAERCQCNTGAPDVFAGTRLVHDIAVSCASFLAEVETSPEVAAYLEQRLGPLAHWHSPGMRRTLEVIRDDARRPRKAAEQHTPLTNEQAPSPSLLFQQVRDRAAELMAIEREFGNDTALAYVNTKLDALISILSAEREGSGEPWDEDSERAEREDRRRERRKEEREGQRIDGRREDAREGKTNG